MGNYNVIRLTFPQQFPHFHIPTSFYVVKQADGDLFFLSLYGKSEEEVSSAGEQLTSNKVYDGENTRKGLSKRGVFSFCGFMYSSSTWLKKSQCQDFSYAQ